MIKMYRKINALYFIGFTIIFCGSGICFPENLIIASASSSYQIEGGWNIDGKGESIWDHHTHNRPELIVDKSNGNIACDSYHNYKEDVQLLSYMRFNMYRFSISWPRILPNGTSKKINKAGIAYYHNLIDELLRNGIQPMVTMYHWELPQQLQEIGGWTNSTIIDYAEDYADLLFKEYGDKVKWWITINEPHMVVVGYTTDWLAPAVNLSTSRYVIGHHLLKAHGRIFRLYQNKYRSQQNGKVSIALDSPYYEAGSKKTEDINAAERAKTFYLDWFAHPIYSKEGDYPALIKRRIAKNSKAEGRNESRLPTFTKEEIDYLRGSSDFFALNYYTSFLCTSTFPNFTKFEHGANEDRAAKCFVNSSLPTSCNPWQSIDSLGFRKLLLRIKKRYNVPIFITENGYFGNDTANELERIKYHYMHIEGILRAMNDDGCSVIGYTMWSLLDSFEWASGYSFKLGLVHVDFQDPQRKRTLKISAEFFKELNEQRKLPDLAKFEHLANSSNNYNLFFVTLICVIVYLFLSFLK